MSADEFALPPYREPPYCAKCEWLHLPEAPCMMADSPVQIAGRILAWEENGKLVDDEAWVQNNAPALAHAYMELYVWREAFADLMRTALADSPALSKAGV